MKKILILLSIFALSACSIPSFLGYGNATVRLNTEFVRNEESFNLVANDFLNQQEIKNLSIKGWEIVNKCSRHSDEGENAPFKCLKGNYPNEEEYLLSNLEEVLLDQKITKSNYLTFLDFLKKYKFDGIGKDDKTVDIESGLNGLRYYANKDNVFTVDEEYIYVKRINDNWYVYTRDWN